MAENGGSSNSEGSQKERKRVGLVYDERMCDHHTPDGSDHPECPDRIRVIWDKLNVSGLTNRCEILNAKEAEDKHIQLVHSKYHVDMIKTISSKQFDSKRKRIASQFNSIYLNKGSSKAAYLAVGSVLEAAEKVAKGDLDSAFAIVRPPGHHAEQNEPMGFCFFNNVAIAASYLLNERPELGIRKILIVDWDVHHGNGTQKMFWKDPRVLFFSVHRHDFGCFYPGSDDGSHTMIGEGPGEGYNINVPWEHGRCGDPDYFAVWDHVLTPVANEFKPDLIIVSAGFDAAVHDPLGGCCITPYGYSILLSKLMDFAQGKIVLALEGGYNLQSLAHSAQACVQVLLEEKPINGSSDGDPFESTWRVIANVRRNLSKYWPSLSDELPRKLTSRTAPPSQRSARSSRRCQSSQPSGQVPSEAGCVQVAGAPNDLAVAIPAENSVVTPAQATTMPDNVGLVATPQTLSPSDLKKDLDSLSTRYWSTSYSGMSKSSSRFLPIIELLKESPLDYRMTEKLQSLLVSSLEEDSSLQCEGSQALELVKRLAEIQKDRRDHVSCYVKEQSQYMAAVDEIQSSSSKLSPLITKDRVVRDRISDLNAQIIVLESRLLSLKEEHDSSLQCKPLEQALEELVQRLKEIGHRYDGSCNVEEQSQYMADVDEFQSLLSKLHPLIAKYKVVRTRKSDLDAQIIVLESRLCSLKEERNSNVKAFLQSLADIRSEIDILSECLLKLSLKLVELCRISSEMC